MKNDDFYVGYMPKMAPSIKTFLKKRLIVFFSCFILIGGLILWNQNNFYPASFDFLNVSSYTGIVWQYPYPHLEVKTPSESYRYLLVNTGKHSAKTTLNGHEVRLKGKLIKRDNEKMIEIVPDSIKVLNNTKHPTKEELILGEKTIHGEIIDSKCFYGVMNPGHLKTHKACAILCIRGGIPPVLYTKQSITKELAQYIILLNKEGKAINNAILDKIAIPLQLTGTLSQLDNFYILKTDPEQL